MSVAGFANPVLKSETAHGSKKPDAVSPARRHFILDMPSRVQSLDARGARLNARPALVAQRALAERLGARAETDSAPVAAEQDSANGRAATMHASPPSPRPAPAPLGTKPVQRYVALDAYYASNDDTAVVGKQKNNKELYATDGRVAEANAVLKQRVSNVRLAATGKTQNYRGRSLKEVQPTLDDASVKANKLAGEVSPVKDPSPASQTGVLMPSECEKGAIAILGAYVEELKHPQNAFVHARKDHSQGRIANLIAASAAGNGQKQTWFTEWTRLEGLVGKASAAYNNVARDQAIDANAGIDDVRNELRAAHANLVDAQFDENFKRDVNEYKVKTSKVKAGGVIERMIRLMDDRINAIEIDVMSSANPLYGGHHQNLLEARDVRGRLEQLYEAANFPKAVIDRALALTGRQADLAKYFADNPSAAGNYQNNLNYLKSSRMRSFLTELVGTLDARIIELEKQRNAEFGNIAGQNQAVDPGIGEAYGILGGHYKFSDAGRWNWHWAGVVLKTGTDNVTMEAHATYKQGNETHNERWDFRMYGKPGRIETRGQTFHDIWRNDGFGLAPVTVLGKPSVDPDPKVAAYGIDPAHLDDYVQGTNALYAILEPMTGWHKSKADLIKYYEGKAAEIADIVQNRLPNLFRANLLNADLLRESQLMTELQEEGSRELFRDVNLEEESMNISQKMRGHLVDFYKTVIAYRHAGRKTGVLV